MKTTAKLFLAGALLAAASAPLVANAAVNVDVNVGLPGFSAYVTPAPVYYPPAYYAAAIRRNVRRYLPTAQPANLTAPRWLIISRCLRRHPMSTIAWA